jgi:hypothetical protein
LLTYGIGSINIEIVMCVGVGVNNDFKTANITEHVPETQLVLTSLWHCRTLLIVKVSEIESPKQ